MERTVIPTDLGGRKRIRRSTGAKRWLKIARNALLFFTVILCLTWICRLIIDTFFEVKLDDRFWVRDFVGNLVVALISLALTRKLSYALLLGGVTIVGFQMANAGKLAILGTPASPDDFLNIQNLFFLTDGWKRIVLMLIAALPFILALVLTPFRKPATWVVLLLLGSTAALASHFSEPLRSTLDINFGNSVWNQPENFRQRGLALHLAQESVRTVAKVGKFPDREAAIAARQDVEQPSQSMPGSIDTTQTTTNAVGTAQRNVHVIVLESFYDPMTLGPEWVPDDPFPVEFRELWAATGNSSALSPVFGGYTANAEFETLCGFPVTENAVFFEGWLRRSVPCLPAVLADAGYQSLASHPNVPGFWNRTVAYHLVGFEQYLSKADFDLEDSIKGLLLDHSYFDQVFNKLEKQQDSRPVFNYMLTYHGHLPYPTSAKYPDQVMAGGDEPLLQGYLNHLWYKSRDLMERLDKLKQEDPNALIVIFGDHLPFLGQSYGVHSEAQGLPEDRADFTGDMLEYLVTTPLIIIDGVNGPLNVGKLPLYRLPSTILSLLNIDNKDGMLDWTTNPEGSLIRPLYGMHIEIGETETISCPNDGSAPAACAESADWLARTRTLISDVFSGRQFSLQKDSDLPSN